MIEAVIFDMDGTLADSTKADYLAWKKLFEDYEKELSYENYIPLLGVKSAIVANDYLNLTDETELQRALARKLVYFEDVIREEGIFALPYARDFLEQVHGSGVRMALATSSRRAKMEMVMERLGFLPFFEIIVAGEEVTNSKPNPEVFLKAAQKLNVSPENCLVFEDAIHGVSAAKAANMKCVAIEAEHVKGLLGEADMVVPGFKGLDFKSITNALWHSF